MIRLRVMQAYLSWVSEPFELALQSARVARLYLSGGDDGFKGSTVVVLLNVSRMRVFLRQLALTDSMKTVGFGYKFRRLCRLLEDYVILLSLRPRKASRVFRDFESSLEENLTMLGRIFGLFFYCSDPFACHFARQSLRMVEMKVYLGLLHCSRRKK